MVSDNHSINSIRTLSQKCGFIKGIGGCGLTEYEPVEFEVSGDKIEAVHMIPGWVHSIINLSDTENLVTIMTCNEIFDPKRLNTFFEKV